MSVPGPAGDYGGEPFSRGHAWDSNSGNADYDELYKVGISTILLRRLPSACR